MSGAGLVGGDFATIAGGAAAGAVEHVLGATGDRTDAAELGQHALATADALFRPGRLFFQDAEKLRVEPGIHGLAGKALGQGLHAGGTAE